MSFHYFITYLIGNALGSDILVGLAIIIGTFILEDPTTVIVGVLAADGLIPIPTALIALYLGIVFGDLWLYGMGYLASTHPWLGRFVNHDRTAPFKSWLESRYQTTIFSVRFIPGLRLPTYTACGFFRTNLTQFFITAIGATLIWTTFLFYASYWFGSLTSQWLDSVRYGLAALFLLALFLIGRHNLKSYRVHKENGGGSTPSS